VSVARSVRSRTTKLAYGVQLAAQAEAILTAGDPIKNARAILRNALPVDNKPIRKVAQELESITESLRIPGKGAYGPVSRAVSSASRTFTSQQANIVKAFADDKRDEGNAAVQGLTKAFRDLENAASLKADKGDIFEYQQECLVYVGRIQEAMVKGFPFELRSCMFPTVPLHMSQRRRAHYILAKSGFCSCEHHACSSVEGCSASHPQYQYIVTVCSSHRVADRSSMAIVCERCRFLQSILTFHN
jgi:hypothetical protein